jgi:hypothetical protein
MYRLLDFTTNRKSKKITRTQTRGEAPMFRFVWNSIVLEHTTREKKICAYNVRIHNVDFHFWFFFWEKEKIFSSFDSLSGSNAATFLHP